MPTNNKKGSRRVSSPVTLEREQEKPQVPQNLSNKNWEHPAVSRMFDNQVRKTSASQKKQGREPGMDDERAKNAVKFLSTIRELTVIVSDNYGIQFAQSEYLTDNPDDIKFLRRDGSFGKIVFEDQFPPDIIKEMEHEKKYITRQEDIYVPIEEQ